MTYSIIIPAYNNEKIIKKTLEAVIDNTPKDVEIIVVDDGSTDRTAEISTNFLLLNKKGVVIPSDHQGPSRVRNIGWKASKGDIVIFLDSDCIPTKNWFEEMIKPFIWKDVVAVQGAYINANPDNIISEYEQLQIDLRQGNKVRNIDNFATYSLAIKRECLEKTGGFDESFKTSSAEDTLLSYKVSELGEIIHNPFAKVKHYHKDSLFSYLKTQFTHGKNRVLMYKKLKFKKVGDKYSGARILIQPFFALFSLLVVYHIIFHPESILPRSSHGPSPNNIFKIISTHHQISAL